MEPGRYLRGWRGNDLHTPPKQKKKTGRAPPPRRPRRMAGSPGPLEVESAEVAGHIDGLADEMQSLHARRLQRLRREIAGVHAPQSHFGLVVAERSRGLHLPILDLTGRCVERPVR